MPYLVNGQLVTEDRVRREEVRLRHDAQLQTIPDDAERARHLRTAAELAAVDVMLVEQIAASDPRPVDPGALEREMQKQRAIGSCRSAEDEHRILQWIEGHFRLQRTAHEMTAGARRPTPQEIEAFYQANRENFRGSAVFEAAHIVKHIDAQQSEEQARAGIEAALAELDSGAAFGEVADRHSDCKGRGGDLGHFLAGRMAPEFENAIRDLKPGERTGIFRTSYGLHIAELRSKIPAGPVPFEEVRPVIRRVLTAIREHKEYLRVIAVLRSRADIRWIAEPAPPKQDHEPQHAVTCS